VRKNIFRAPQQINDKNRLVFTSDLRKINSFTIDLLALQKRQFALNLRHATAPIRELALAFLAHKGCLLGFGLATFGLDYDCTHFVVIGIPNLHLQEKHGRFFAEFVGNILDYGKLYLDDG
jgi:hypothetical protein